MKKTLLSSVVFGFLVFFSSSHGALAEVPQDDNPYLRYPLVHSQNGMKTDAETNLFSSRIFWEKPEFGLTPWSKYIQGDFPDKVIKHINTRNYERAGYFMRRLLYDSQTRSNRDLWGIYSRLLLSSEDFQGAIGTAYRAVSSQGVSPDVYAILSIAYVLGPKDKTLADYYTEKLKAACRDCQLTKNVVRMQHFFATREKDEETKK